MKPRRRAARGTLLVGVDPRLAGAILIAMSLWAGFFWATSAPGSL